MLAVFPAAGCGGEVIDSQKTEEQVKANTEHVRGEKVSAVECPSEVEIEVGSTFTCTVKLASGKEETATLKIRDKEADLDFEALTPSK